MNNTDSPPKRAGGVTEVTETTVSRGEGPIKAEAQSIAIVSQSGRGKTMSFRNLDPETTGFINSEDKPLPYPNKFKNYTRTSNATEMLNALIAYGKDPKITQVAFDSFLGYSDAVYKVAKSRFSGYDIYSYYNEEITKFLGLIKKYPKEIFVTAHYEMINVDGDGLTEKRIFVRGKEHEGKVERHFTIVMYADVLITDSKNEYYFNLNSDGRTSAKTPPYLFPGVSKIENDVNLILKAIRNK